MTAAATESRLFRDESEVERRGIVLGSYECEAIDDVGMTTPADPTDRIAHPPRQRDRRCAIADLVATLSRAIDRRHDISTLRGVFEEAMRRIVPVRSIQLREGSSPWTT